MVLALGRSVEGMIDQVMIKMLGKANDEDKF